MKKFFKKIFGGISAFIIGAQTKVFAAGILSEEIINPGHQVVLYGPPPTPPEEGFPPAITGAQIISIIASILLFIIGIIVILNKKISKKVKIIVSSIIAILIVVLVLFCIFFN
ncbi:MAG: hypothetical protein IKD77_04770 [Bacilli bacterium]|nr:hypothetical protein [Bacilli bacterium]